MKQKNTKYISRIVFVINVYVYVNNKSTKYCNQVIIQNAKVTKLFKG